jgi:hypothetical protein
LLYTPLKLFLFNFGLNFLTPWPRRSGTAIHQLCNYITENCGWDEKPTLQPTRPPSEIAFLNADCIDACWPPISFIDQVLSEAYNCFHSPIGL